MVGVNDNVSVVLLPLLHDYYSVALLLRLHSIKPL
jgi:hypothetical protein